ncbi:MAG: prepilin-type N-terminal cleavage/methylation domain-containing protein [Sedimentisphaerales bacterium]
MKKRNGFTLVEILIVVVILGILAAIVIPQFSSASEDAKLSTLLSDLQTVRSQLQLYKLQHKGVFTAITSSATFITQMTSYTDDSGVVATTQAPAAGVYGPYLQKMPKNPFNTTDTSDNVTVVTTGSPAVSTTIGWWFNSTTGTFNAIDSAEHMAL